MALVLPGRRQTVREYTNVRHQITEDVTGPRVVVLDRNDEETVWAFEGFLVSRGLGGGGMMLVSCPSSNVGAYDVCETPESDAVSWNSLMVPP